MDHKDPRTAEEKILASLKAACAEAKAGTQTPKFYPIPEVDIWVADRRVFLRVHDQNRAVANACIPMIASNKLAKGRIDYKPDGYPWEWAFTPA